MRRLAIGTVLWLVATAANAADPWNGCFTQRFDAPQLASNPRQILESISVELFRAPTNDDDIWSVGITAELVRNKKRWGNGGQCSPDGTKLRCGLDGDSGQIVLSRAGDGVQLAIEHLNLDVLESPLPNAGIRLGRNDPRNITLRPGERKACEAHKPAKPSQDRWAGCFLRQYDAAHMAKNPGQRVNVMAVSLARAEGAGGAYHMFVYALRPSAKGQLKNFGTCKPRDGKLQCGVDVGSGSFSLTRTADGLQLDNPDRFHLRFEKEDGGLMIEGKDHRAFRLPPAEERDCQ